MKCQHARNMRQHSLPLTHLSQSYSQNISASIVTHIRCIRNQLKFENGQQLIGQKKFEQRWKFREQQGTKQSTITGPTLVKLNFLAHFMEKHCSLANNLLILEISCESNDPGSFILALSVLSQFFFFNPKEI